MEERDPRPGGGELEQPRPQAAETPQGRPARESSSMAPRPWTTGSAGRGGAGSTRWASIGCGVVVLILVGLLMAGVTLTKRTAWIAFERGRQRLVEAVGREHPVERLRTTRNLDRFAARLRASRDPYRELGEFLEQVRAALADGRLDAAELGSLNRYLEGSAPLSGDGRAP